MGQGNSHTAPDADTTPEFTLEMQLNLHVEVEDIIHTAEEAGRVIMQIYEGDQDRWDVVTKSDNSPLTRADREANAVIVSALQRLTPHIPIVSEETSLVPHDTRKNYQYHWLVDPLDGTKEFVKRNGEFTVNIALITKGNPVLGVVHVPCQNKTYWAVKNKGAFLRTGAEQKQIKCSEFKLTQPGLRIVASKSHASAETADFIAMFPQPELLSVGSSLKLLMVAEGAADIYPRLAPTCEWDTAAADVIVREAGGVTLFAGVCDNKGVAEEDWKEALLLETHVLYNKANILNPFFVVFGIRKAED